MVIPPMRIEPVVREPRVSLSAPIAATERNMSRRLPAMVISSTGYRIASLHPVARRAARIVAGHQIHPEADQLGHQQPPAHLANQAGKIEVAALQDQIVIAARAAGGLHPELARGVAPEKIAAQHSALEQVVRHRRLEQHRRLDRPDLAASEPCESAPPGIVADGFGFGQVLRGTLRYIPVVALHAAVLGREPRALVLGGEARDRQGRLHRVAHRAWGKIRGARVAFPLAYVHRHREALVAVVFDGLDLALAYRHRLTVAVGALGFTGARAFFNGVRQGIRGDALQRVEIVGEAAWGHAGTQRERRYDISSSLASLERAGRGKAQQDRAQARHARTADPWRAPGRAQLGAAHCDRAARGLAGRDRAGAAHHEARGAAPAAAIHWQAYARRGSGTDP